MAGEAIDCRFSRAQGKYGTNIACQPLRADQTNAAVAFLKAENFVLFGSRLESLYRSVCEDAAAGRGPVVVLAWDEDRPAAAVVAVIDYVRYRRSALLRNPLTLLRILLGRLREKLTSGGDKPDSEGGGGGANLEPTPPDKAGAWWESDGGIAKTAYIATAPQYRRQGLAHALYEKLFEELRLKGVRRLDATVRLDNAASIKMHRRLGFQVYSDGDRCLALKNLQI